MGVRGAKDIEFKDRVDELLRFIRRAYVAWLVGVTIGALGVRPTTFNVGGLTLTVEKPEAIQGLLFLLALGFTYWSLAKARRLFRAREFLRDAIYSALPRGRTTLVNKGRQELDVVRRRAISRLRASMAVFVTVILIPAAFIFVVHAHPLKQAVDLLLGKR